MNNYYGFYVKWHSAQHVCNGPEFRYLPFALHSKTFLSGKVHFLERGVTFVARRSIHLHLRVRGIAPRCIGLMATLIDRRIFLQCLSPRKSKGEKGYFENAGNLLRCTVLLLSFTNDLPTRLPSSLRVIPE